MTKQEFQKLTEDHVLLLDGATGSNLMKAGMPRGVCTESWVLEHKDVIQSLQKAYIEAGSHIIYAPTFGGNRINLTMHGLEEQIGYLRDAGVDLIVAETMINIEETLAAVDACQSVCELPIICTVTVEADGSIFSGGNAIEAAMSLEAAGADAVGINCSVGPDQLVSVIRNIKENVSIPVIAKPNAGMPQIDDLGNAVYSMTPADFAGYMKVLVDNGASVIGGCCGTTPEFISETAQVLGLR